MPGIHWEGGWAAPPPPPQSGACPPHACRMPSSKGPYARTPPGSTHRHPPFRLHAPTRRCFFLPNFALWRALPVPAWEEGRQEAEAAVVRNGTPVPLSRGTLPPRRLGSPTPLRPWLQTSLGHIKGAGGCLQGVPPPPLVVAGRRWRSKATASLSPTPPPPPTPTPAPTGAELSHDVRFGQTPEPCELPGARRSRPPLLPLPSCPGRGPLLVSVLLLENAYHQPPSVPLQPSLDAPPIAIGCPSSAVQSCGQTLELLAGRPEFVCLNVSSNQSCPRTPPFRPSHSPTSWRPHPPGRSA